MLNTSFALWKEELPMEIRFIRKELQAPSCTPNLAIDSLGEIKSLHKADKDDE
jgi:hypothetical protein